MNLVLCMLFAGTVPAAPAAEFRVASAEERISRPQSAADWLQVGSAATLGGTFLTACVVMPLVTRGELSRQEQRWTRRIGCGAALGWGLYLGSLVLRAVKKR